MITYAYAFGKRFYSKQLVSQLGMWRDILRGWGSSVTSTMGTFVQKIILFFIKVKVKVVKCGQVW